MTRDTKADRIAALIGSYRENTSQDNAFDELAAEWLRISPTDLRCLDIIQGRAGLTAGELATASGLTTGAVTAVIDRLERAGLARRVRDDADRRKVNVEVTELHYEETGKIWGPMMADWNQELMGRFTAAELATISEFLETTTELAAKHSGRIRRLNDEAGDR